MIRRPSPAVEPHRPRPRRRLSRCLARSIARSIGARPRLRRPWLSAGVALFVLSGASAAGDPETALRFVDGQAQVVRAFADEDDWIRHDLWVETEFDSDGDGRPDRMHVDVTRPGQTETEGLRVPVVYETSPYYCGTSSTSSRYFWDPGHELGAEPPERTHPPSIRHRSLRPTMSRTLIAEWVPRGFAVVHSASPGTGLSQGCPTVGGPNESLAPKAVIDWLNGRAAGFTSPDGDERVAATWATGKVGMTGTSYNGTLCLAAATTGVDGLEAIVPVAPNTSYYHYYRSNGLVRHPGGYMGEDVDVLYDFINSGAPERREWCDCHVRDEEMARGADRLTGDYNEFWAGRNLRAQLDGVKAATLMAHAFNDWNVMPEHSVRVHAALTAKGVPTQAYFHQGGHGGPPPHALMNRWLTRYVCGVENGVEDDPRAWIVREGDPAGEPTPYPAYPHPAAEPVVLHLAPGGAAIGGLQRTAVAEPGSETLVDDASIPGAQLAQAEHSPHRLLYATPELTRPVHLSGTGRLTVRVACDRPAANLSVWVVSLPWEPDATTNANLVTRGWADPQNHGSLTRGEPLEPGRRVDLTFDLQPDDQIVPAGQRLGLMVLSSDHDFTLRPAPGARLTMDLAATTLELPVVGGAEAWRAAVEPDRR